MRTPGRVLQRDPRPRVDRLRLREQERLGLPRRQRRLEPLQAHRPRARSDRRSGPASASGVRSIVSREPRIGSAGASWNRAGREAAGVAEPASTPGPRPPRSSARECRGSAERPPGPGLPLEVEDGDAFQLLSVEVRRSGRDRDESLRTWPGLPSVWRVGPVGFAAGPTVRCSLPPRNMDSPC